MGIFLVYILKSSVCLALFYLFYRLLLSKETFHRFNRLALLGLLVLSCAVPFVEVTVQEPSGMAQPFLSLEEMMGMMEVEPAAVLDETPMYFPWKELLLLLYVGGILFFFIRHLWSLGRMVRLLRACRKEKMEEGITLYVHREKVAPFSWMKMIVLSEDDLKENGKAILTHERAHIHNLHSWDLLLAEVCIFFQWFNPAAWLLKQELQNIHEYEADEWVIENGIDAKTYQLLIIKKAVGARLYSIANSFNHSSLKKRITMMIKKKSNPWARMKYLYVLPLAAVTVAAFARPEVSNKLDEISSVKVNDLTSIVKAEEVKSVENSSDEKFILNGQVMEYSSKKPVPGASVIIRGTTNGAMTDADGKFKLQVKKGDVIIVSYVGLQTQQLPVQSGANLVVWMREEVQSMEEMVVYAANGEKAEKGKRGPVVFDMPIEEAMKEEIKQEKAPQEEVVFRVVEEMPSYPGGMQKAMRFLAKNIKYPVTAQEAKIEGRVIVQFVVRRDGSVSDIHTVRGVSPELDAEAMRVVSLMPKWNPGKQRGKAVSVKYTMPITFRLQTPAPKSEEEKAPLQLQMTVANDADASIVSDVKNHLRSYYTTNLPDSLKVRASDGKSPLVIIDGEVKGNGLDMIKSVPIDQIASITVMKNQDAIAQYGDKAKDGAISISTKKDKQ